MRAQKHRDIPASDIEWRDGSEEGIKYARFRMDETNAASPSIIISRFAPGASVAAHTHASNYFEYILKGDQMVGKKVFRAGDVRIVEGGTGYGPIKVGPEGCTVLIVFEDASRSMTEFLPRKEAGGSQGKRSA
jgi:anti-sigma factor ChrR (cupin superfamily)